MRIKEGEKVQLSICNQSGDIIHSKTYKEWNNLRILQERGGKYAIVDEK